MSLIFLFHMSMGENYATRTAGFGPCFCLPGFRFGNLCLTHGLTFRFGLIA